MANHKMRPPMSGRMPRSHKVRALSPRVLR